MKNQKKMRIFQKAQIEDLERIVQIYNESIPSRMSTADIEPIPSKERHSWFVQRDWSRYPIWVIKEEATILGWCAIGPFYGRKAYEGIGEISIYLSLQFQQKGIGRAALSFIIIEAKKIQFHTLLAYVFEQNSPSMKLFDLAGFRPFGRIPQAAHFPDATRDLIILGVSLNP